MKKCEVKYEAKYEDVKNKKPEDKDRIFNMIEEGGPVYVEKKEVCDDGEEVIEDVKVSQ